MNGIYIYLQRNRRYLRRERLFRDRLNPLEVFDDTEIRSLFRFQRCHIISIVEDVRPHLEVGTGRGRSLAPLQQICIALRFYATWSMQLSLGVWISVHQSTVCRTVWAVTCALLRTVWTVLCALLRTVWAVTCTLLRTYPESCTNDGDV